MTLPWGGVEAPRILVTGATGFVGPHVLAALAGRVPASAMIETWGGPGSRSALPSQLPTRRLDIADDAAVADAVAAFRPSHVLHAAGLSIAGDAERDPARAFATNLTGTRALAEAVLRHAPGALFVFVSSAQVYGKSFATGAALDETALLGPLHTYATTKAAADLSMEEFAARGLHTLRLRPFNHAGPGQSPRLVIARFARAIALIEAGRDPPVLAVGNLKVARDFLDVADIASAYVAALEQGQALKPGTILNIASGIAWPIGVVLDKLLALSSATVEIKSDPTLFRGDEVSIMRGDAGRAKALLGWSPTISLDAMLPRVLADWRQREGKT